jgi:hypothetical protein
LPAITGAINFGISIFGFLAASTYQDYPAAPSPKWMIFLGQPVRGTAVRSERDSAHQ